MEGRKGADTRPWPTWGVETVSTWLVINTDIVQSLPHAATSSMITASRLYSEVKLDRAEVVLSWGTRWEGSVLHVFCFLAWFTHRQRLPPPLLPSLRCPHALTESRPQPRETLQGNSTITTSHSSHHFAIGHFTSCLFLLILSFFPSSRCYSFAPPL